MEQRHITDHACGRIKLKQITRELMYTGNLMLVKRLRFLRYLHEPNGRVLDVGCGEGVFSFLAYGLHYDVLGIDLDEKSIQILENRRRRMGIPEEALSFRAMDIRDLDAGRGGFDYIFCFEVLEHILDDADLLDGLTNILVPHGKLFIGVPNKNSPSLYGDSVSKIEDGNHVRKGYTFQELRALLSSRELTIQLEDSYAGFFTQKAVSLDRFMRSRFRCFCGLPRKVCLVILYLLTFLDPLVPCEGHLLFVVVEKTCENKSFLFTAEQTKETHHPRY